ncbi:molybdopterin molybdotransferase [Sulfuritortus calidifontis]|uniref:Molybdopterin molybdenumtransferase n=1 Tax=Sulfuritortus calidifontis TaxID=1914471 RepID=A0A4V2UR52_9PROT|nr:gephyrin-like molybdotransferase Glp [Sulfuritortus calidifontis]TCS74037.1 molybdopterin molybdotransferase [Sulfuritortus calidifontis]
MLSADEARAKLLDNARPVRQTEAIPLEAALGRVLAEPLIAAVTVPPLDNSAMDGYALRLADWAEDKWLHVAQRIPAGQLGHPLTLGTAARIFTGAPVPEGADTVVMQEDCEVRDDHVRIAKPPKLGAHIRRAGEDIAHGQTVLQAGERLNAARLGVAASVGATELTVHRKLKVALFFTGDEIVLPGHPLKAGQIYNSNRATLLALLQGLGCEVHDLGIVADNLDATVNALEQASRHADVVITSGGVSVGEEDHVKAAVERLGRIEMWKVAMKPGKPLVYGRLNTIAGVDTDFLGLPGNPVSAFVVFCLFVRPFLLARMGAARAEALSFTVPAGFDWKKPGERREFLRARIEHGRAVLYPNQSSGVLTSVAWADGLVDIESGHTVREGDDVRFWPLTELLK